MPVGGTDCSVVSALLGTHEKIVRATATSAATTPKAMASGHACVFSQCHVSVAAAGAPSWQSNSTRATMPSAAPCSWGPRAHAKLVRSNGYIMAFAAPMQAIANNCQPAEEHTKRPHMSTALAPATRIIALGWRRPAKQGRQKSSPTALAAKNTDSKAPMASSDQSKTLLQKKGHVVTPEEIPHCAKSKPTASGMQLGNRQATNSPPNGLAFCQANGDRPSRGCVSGKRSAVIRSVMTEMAVATAKALCGPTMLATAPPQGGPNNWPSQQQLSRRPKSRARSFWGRWVVMSAPEAKTVPLTT
mmetsp:Transcript_3716/g.10237  ORF Transcript_3716/g.10237 Transcript_3716/m.10237 type:complete len:302 (-) Transcript_3716:504-1409(-)